jgi:hypothetical protein
LDGFSLPSPCRPPETVRFPCASSSEEARRKSELVWTEASLVPSPLVVERWSRQGIALVNQQPLPIRRLHGGLGSWPYSILLFFFFCSRYDRVSICFCFLFSLTDIHARSQFLAYEHYPDDLFKADLVIRDLKGEKSSCNSILNNKVIPSSWISLGSLATKSTLRLQQMLRLSGWRKGMYKEHNKNKALVLT